MRFSWLTSSVLLLLAVNSLPVAAQTVLFDESFANPTVTNPGNFIYGIGTPPPGSPPPDPPCLTAAPLQINPPTTGKRVGIPGCRTNTTNVGTLPDPAGTGVLRLTSSKNDQAGFVLFSKNIPADQGLIITFDFYTYNGNGADGISFFLIAGRFYPQVSGAFGGSLGYAQKTVPVNIDGLLGGYVGIGFDEGGNYSNPTEGRVGGAGFMPDAVAIRGRAGSIARGYRYLTGTGNGTVPPLPGSIDNPNATNRNAAGVKRTVRITLTPDNKISVEINFGGGFVNVIPSFDLNTAPGQGSLPAKFKFGFAASTGGQRNIHEIQNLKIVTLSPDLSITQTSSTSFIVGKQGSYTLTVGNSASAGSTTSSITVSDTLPPGFNFISATGTDWICSAQNSKMTCTYADASLPLKPGQIAPPIQITVLPTATAGNPSTNTATVSTPGDSNPGNNTATINTPVVKPPPPPICNRGENICKF